MSCILLYPYPFKLNQESDTKLLQKNFWYTYLGSPPSHSKSQFTTESGVGWGAHTDMNHGYLPYSGKRGGNVFCLLICVRVGGSPKLLYVIFIYISMETSWNVFDWLTYHMLIYIYINGSVIPHTGDCKIAFCYLIPDAFNFNIIFVKIYMFLMGFPAIYSSCFMLYHRCFLCYILYCFRTLAMWKCLTPYVLYLS